MSPSLSRWTTAAGEILRGHYRRLDYEPVLVAMLALRRLDCMAHPGATDRFSLSVLRNTTTPEAVLQHIRGLPDEIRRPLEALEFHAELPRLISADLLRPLVEHTLTLDLSPSSVSTYQMGLFFEEILRQFTTGPDLGDYYTPTDVIELVVALATAPLESQLAERTAPLRLYDPTCGSGGLLAHARRRLIEQYPRLACHIYGQDLNPRAYAVAAIDALLQEAGEIRFGDTLTDDHFAGQHFDLMLANPPYGVDWKQQQAAVRKEHALGQRGRFGPGLPRVTDGSLLFLLHMLAKCHPPEMGGSRIAVVFNGSPLFTGNAGSGESQIRRHLIENDLVEAIVCLPESLFVNTAISTYLWLVTNRKERERAGFIQLIDATERASPMRRALGEKRKELGPEAISAILAEHRECAESDTSKMCRGTDFGFRRHTIERARRMVFAMTAESADAVATSKAAEALVMSAPSEPTAPVQQSFFDAWEEAPVANGARSPLHVALAALVGQEWLSRAAFEAAATQSLKRAGVALSGPLRKTLLQTCGRSDERGECCVDANGRPEADPERRDYESVPLGTTIDDYMRQEVLPHWQDAWVNNEVCDPVDGQPGIVGYEINPRRLFYRYTPPRPLEEIDAELRELFAHELKLMSDVLGVPVSPAVADWLQELRGPKPVA